MQACGAPSWHVCYGFGSAVCHAWTYTPVGSLAACLVGCDVIQGPAESYLDASGKSLRAQKKDPPGRLSVPVLAGPRAFGPWPTARQPNRTVSGLPVCQCPHGNHAAPAAENPMEAEAVAEAPEAAQLRPLAAAAVRGRIVPR